MKIAHPWPSFESKLPPSERICATCPFHPSGKGHGVGHPDFEPGGHLLRMIELGCNFPCHETALLDPRTRFEGPAILPDQPHFRACLGAVLYKRGLIDSPGTAPQGGTPP